jgi:hypothetical protein
MTREYLGRFSALELAMAIASVVLIAGALGWVFFGESAHREWRWLLLAALVLSVLGRFIHQRRLRREYGEAGPDRL